MLQVFERSGFNPKEDKLIFLGDVADGWPQTYQCIDALCKIPYLVSLMGNHDKWLRDWARGAGKRGGFPEPLWVTQGGQATLESYQYQIPPDTHMEYLANLKSYYLDDQNRLFVHGGIYTHIPITEMESEMMWWDRSLWVKACTEDEAYVKCGRKGNPPQLTKYPEVFVGHTTTTRLGEVVPVRRCEVWNLDTGAGWEGKLSIMDVDTKEFWQSDVVKTLYPYVTGR